MRANNTVRIVLLTLAAAAAFGLAVGGAIVFGGLYNVASTAQHTQPVYSVLELAMRQSVRLRARDIEVPTLDDERLVVRGAACFKEKCVQCHGAPGVAQNDIGKSMQPVPGPLVDAGQRWRSRELYWLTRHGIKMSGMPAWEFHLADEDIWAVVAFVGRLPALTPQQYAALGESPAVRTGSRPSTGSATPTPVSCGVTLAQALPADGGDIHRGKRAMYQYACNACHTIPGVTGSRPNVGPPLAGVSGRRLIAGKLPNTPENMVRWLRYTHEVAPASAMPEMGVSARDARDLAAYLATLD